MFAMRPIASVTAKPLIGPLPNWNRKAEEITAKIFLPERFSEPLPQADEGITAWGSPTDTSPIEADFGRRLDATAHELGALALYFVAGDAGPESPPLAGANTRVRRALGGP